MWRPRRRLAELEERIAALEEAKPHWGDPVPRVEIPTTDLDPSALWSGAVESYASYIDEGEDWHGQYL